MNSTRIYFSSKYRETNRPDICVRSVEAILVEVVQLTTRRERDDDDETAKGRRVENSRLNSVFHGEQFPAGSIYTPSNLDFDQEYIAAIRARSNP